MQQNNYLKHVLDYNSDKDGMGNWIYNLKIKVVVMLMLMIIYKLICISERRTHVNGSIIIIKHTHTYPLFGYYSPNCIKHVSTTFLATI